MGNDACANPKSRNSAVMAADSLGAAAIKDYHFTDLSDFLARVPGIEQEDANIFLTVDCTIYKVELEGRVGRVRRRATAVVQRGSSGGSTRSSSSASTASTGSSGTDLVILRWQEET